MSALVLPLPGHEAVAARIGELVDAPVGRVSSRRFPDGETYLRVDADCAGRRVVLAATLTDPDRTLFSLILLADCVRSLGASRVGLVVPYLAYMRQDHQFQPGEAVTSRTVGALLSKYVDWLVTVDPHLHRYRSLDEIYSVPSRVVHAAPALAAWIAAEVDRPVVVGPDEESKQWVSEVAALARAPHLVLRKVRRGDRSVEVSAPEMEAYCDRTPVVVDDIVSTARTMAETVKCLVGGGLRAPVCVAVHALFGADAEAALRDSGAARIVTTNTVPHGTNAIDVMPLIAGVIRELI